MKSEFIVYGMWAMGALAVGNFVYQAFKNHGVKGAIFGAPIGRTVGELDLGKNGPMSTKLKIHTLKSNELGTPTVGIELVNKSVASYQMMPIRLTTEQAGVLKELLAQAAAESRG
ncbi:MAG: hypothetical protein ACRD5M_08880 [Candidatus Acidiferrales bacterium]